MSYTLKIKLAENAPPFVKEHYQNFTSHHIGDSGIDLIVPEDVVVGNLSVGTIDHLIQCEMTNYLNEIVSYYLYPRSSISKTPFTMANSVGVIDAGYRGNIMAKIRNMDLTNSNKVLLGDKMFQICSPDLRPIKIKIVDTLSETSRGSGGFGSTYQVL